MSYPVSISLRDILATRKDGRLRKHELEELQSKRLRNLIHHAYHHVPYYRQMFKQLGLEPSSIIRKEDLAKLPIITKMTFQAGSKDDFLPDNIPREELLSFKTSGSTGIPLTLYYTRRDAARLRAISGRTLLENGMSARDLRARIIQPYDFAPTGILTKFFFRTRDFSVLEDPKKIAKELDLIKPNILETYGSTWRLLVRALDEANARHVRPRIAVSEAEILDDSTRRLVDSHFGIKMIDMYGSHETRILAWECKYHSGYHINMDSIAVEFIKDGEPVSSGERGKVVITNLFSYGMPLIRYELGDIAIPSSDECHCGLKLPLLKKIEGKTMDFIVLPSGKLIDPHSLKRVFTLRPQIYMFKIVQKGTDELLVQIVKGNGYSFNIEKEVIAELTGLTRSEMKISLTYVEEIKIPLNGKHKVIESVVHPNF